MRFKWSGVRECPASRSTKSILPTFKNRIRLTIGVRGCLAGRGNHGGFLKCFDRFCSSVLRWDVNFSCCQICRFYVLSSASGIQTKSGRTDCCRNYIPDDRRTVRRLAITSLSSRVCLFGCRHFSWSALLWLPHRLWRLVILGSWYNYVFDRCRFDCVFHATGWYCPICNCSC